MNYMIIAYMAGLLLIGCSDNDNPASTSSIAGPTIVAMSPAPGHSYMAMGQDFVVEFSEAMDHESVEEAYQVMTDQGGVAGDYTWNDEGTMMTFSPSASIDPDMELLISWGSGMRDRRGRGMRRSDGRSLGPFEFRGRMYSAPTEFSSNGERIYFTATSESGEPITFDMGTDFDDGIMPGYGMFSSAGMGGGMMGGGMMGSGSTGHYGMACVTCHGPDGKGGRYLAMGEVETPDIRYSVLVGELAGEEAETGEEGHDEEGEEHAHEPYTDETIKQAITQGIEPDEKALDAFMPRWSMADRDLDDLLEFLKYL